MGCPGTKPKYGQTARGQTDKRYQTAEFLTSAGRTLATYVDPEDYVISYVVIKNATLLKRSRPFPRVIAGASLACSLPGVGGCLIAAGPMSGVLASGRDYPRTSRTIRRKQRRIQPDHEITRSMYLTPLSTVKPDTDPQSARGHSDIRRSAPSSSPQTLKRLPPTR